MTIACREPESCKASCSYTGSPEVELRPLAHCAECNNWTAYLFIYGPFAKVRHCFRCMTMEERWAFELTFYGEQENYAGIA
jgi:hypothetical protein